MSKAKKSFISSTFWSEGIGFVAGISTIDIFRKKKVWKKLIKSGKYINQKWLDLSKKYELPITVSGIESITQFNFNLKNNRNYKTYITQELLKKRILATNLIFLNIFHTKEIIDKYILELDKIFCKIKLFEEKNIKENFLKGRKAQKHFGRLTD